MLKKLLKYDIKYMFKNMIIFYILAIFFALSTRILFSLNQTTFINITGQISVGCMFSMVGSILFNTIIRSYVRFRDSIYKDESYLTHTLPVTKTQIYESRFIQALIFTFVGFAIMVLCIFITYYTKDRWLMLKDALDSISLGLNINTPFIVISIIVILFLEIFNIIQCGFLGLIKGHRYNNNKIAYSFLFGFITYLISQLFVVLSIFIIGLFNSNIMNIFISNIMIDSSTLKLLIIFTIIIYSTIILLMNVVGVKLLNKGVDIE